MRPTAEFELATQSCRRAFAPDRSTYFPDLDAIDWPLFLRTVRHHRVQGLVNKGLSALRNHVPPEIAQALAGEARDIALHNLRSAAVSVTLVEAFAAAGVSLLFVKGLALSALAYGEPGIKGAADVDVLIAPEDLERAARVLTGCGFSLLTPADPRKLTKWHGRNKESVWIAADGRVQIDLHTRLADSPVLIPHIGMQSPSQSVAVSPAVELPTLADEPLFAYLCVHGASSCWFRLKWVCDLAAFLHRRSGDELALLYRRSQLLGAGRAAGQALLLADRLFGTLADASCLKQSLQADAGTAALADRALYMLAARKDPVEPTEARFGTVPIHFSQLFLRPGLGFKLSELRRQLRLAIR